MKPALTLLALGRGSAVGGGVMDGTEMLGKEVEGEDGYEDEWSKVEVKAVCPRLGRVAEDEAPPGVTADGGKA